MRVSTSRSLFVASTFFCLGSSLPFFPRKNEINRRATYSVVPVDGGAAATTNTAGQGEVTIVKTIVETPAPATQTIVKTDTLPPTTDTIISTQTIEGQKTTQIIQVTVTPTATAVTITATEYSVINIGGPTTIVLPPTTTTSPATQVSPASSRSAESSSSTTDKTSPALTTTTSQTSHSTTSSSTTTSLPAIAVSTTSAPSTLETSYTSTYTYATTSTSAYDNGQWHTTYPPWSNATATLRMASTPVQSTLPFPTDLAGGVADDLAGFRALFQFFRRSLNSLKARLL